MTTDAAVTPPSPETQAYVSAARRAVEEWRRLPADLRTGQALASLLADRLDAVNGQSEQ